MGNRYKRVIGWEKFGGEWLLRMALAEPRLTPVWPGSPTIAEPGGELRRVTDEVLTLAQANYIVRDFPPTQHKVTERDVRLLWQALSQYPPHVRGAPCKAPPEFPPPF
jgi:hypothetical protein